MSWPAVYVPFPPLTWWVPWLMGSVLGYWLGWRAAKRGGGA